MRVVSNTQRTGVWGLTGKGGYMDKCIFPLQTDNICIGTDSNFCTIIYDSSEKGIAALHCQITWSNGVWLLTDFSEAGTWLNNQRLPKNQPIRLNPDDVIMLANSENTFIVTYNGINHKKATSSEDSAKRSSTQVNAQREESFRKKFFSCKGRLNRKPYFIRVVPLAILGSIFFEILMELDEIPYSELNTGMEILTYVIIFLLFPILISCYMNAIRRLHDLDKSGWFVLIMFAPTINIIFGWYLMLKKGTSGANRYGDDPLEGR